MLFTLIINFVKTTVAVQKIRTAFGNDAISDRTIQKWFKKLSSGDLRLIDETRSGRPKIINNEDLEQVVQTNFTTTCLELEERSSVYDGKIRLHLHQLGNMWKLSKRVPHDLSNDNKLSRLTVCSANISRSDNEPFLDLLLIYDKM